jgi:Putative adhesin
MKFRAITICLVLVFSSVNIWAGTASSADEGGQKVERTIAADPAVTVSVCVMSGNISVRGWDKNEVTARSHDAAQIELRRKDAPGTSSQAVKVEVFVADKDSAHVKANCQSFSDLELNVPRGAAVHVQTRDGNISIVDVGMAFAGSQNGDISVERVSRAIEVGSVGGSVCVKNSSGRANVSTIGGGIDVANLRPVDSGDVFEAASVSGDLMLDGVSHTLLKARTVSGNVQLSGPLASRGRYGFQTLSGDVTLAMPVDASFNLIARVSQDGEIFSDFPLTLIPDPPPTATPPTPPAAGTAPKAPVRVMPPKPPSDSSTTPGVSTTPAPIIKVTPRVKTVVVSTPAVAAHVLRRFTAVCGTGDATITVASFSGTLRLQKSN